MAKERTRKKRRPGHQRRNEMLKTITSQIEKAWEDIGSEFASTRNPKAVFWTEQASLKYPFYFNLSNKVPSHKVPPYRINFYNLPII